MTAIRPRPSPEQQRRAEAQAQAQAQAAKADANRILLSQSLFPLALAVFYIALLIVPWALTLKIASEPSFIIHVYHWGYRYYIQYGWLIAIDVLNSLAAVLSLPILSALLARAAAVFSQRRKPGQTLSVRQLFALADRDWYNLFKVMSPFESSALLRLGFLVLFIAVILPLLRSALVTRDNVLVFSNLPENYDGSFEELLGYSPSPLSLKTGDSESRSRVTEATLKSLQTTTGGIEPNLWPVCNDNVSDSTCGFRYGPYDLAQSTLSNFWENSNDYWDNEEHETNGSALMHASTYRAGSTIGSYRDNDFGAYALGLKTGTKCETVSAQDVAEQCLRSTNSGVLPTAALGWNTSLAIEGQLSLDICYPPLEKDPWEAADASPWKPISFTEHLYVGLRDPRSFDWGCSSPSDDCSYLGNYDGLYFHCQADSMMSYFEIGSDRTNGVPTRFMEELPPGFELPRNRLFDRADSLSDGGQTGFYLGPLKTATMAMFGDDSWLDTLNIFMADSQAANETMAAALTMLCSARPFGHIDTFSGSILCSYPEWYYSYGYTPERIFSTLVRDFFHAFDTKKMARATLNTATFYANNALLSEMLEGTSYYKRDHKYTSESSDERMTVPVLSVAAIATVSVFIGLQVICILVLLAYIYSSHVWTKTLDAMAMARVGAQLSALDVFLVPRETGTLGQARLSRRAAKQLDQIDGLVGSTVLAAQHHDVEMATMPPPYAPRGEEPSTREERRVSQQPGPATARNTTTPDHPAPSYSPPADEHTTRTADGEAGASSRHGDASDMEISHAASSESQGAVLPAEMSLEAVAVGGRGPITRRMWRKADKPLPAPPAQE